MLFRSHLLRPFSCHAQPCPKGLSRWDSKVSSHLVAEVVPGAASVTAEVVAALEAVEVPEVASVTAEVVVASVTAEVVVASEAVEAPEEASVTEVAAVVAEDLLQEAVRSD